MKIGKDATTTNFDFAGDVAEILIFDRQLSTVEDEQVEGYLGQRWGAAELLARVLCQSRSLAHCSQLR